MGWGRRKEEEEGGEGQGLRAVGLGAPLAEASEGGNSSGLGANGLIHGRERHGGPVQILIGFGRQCETVFWPHNAHLTVLC